jgi:DNA topoisomerase II
MSRHVHIGDTEVLYDNYVFQDYKEHHDNVNVHFVITMSPSGMKKAEEQGFVEFFKLITKINTTNMICFDFDCKIKKYASPEEILEDFYPKRLAYYQKRKVHFFLKRTLWSLNFSLVQDFLANELQNQLDKLNNQARFVRMIVDKQLVVSNRKKDDIVAELRQKGFRPFPKVSKAKAAGETEDLAEDEEQEVIGASSDYDYLLGMAIWSLTREKVAQLYSLLFPIPHLTLYQDREADAAIQREGEGTACVAREDASAGLE